MIIQKIVLRAEEIFFLMENTQLGYLVSNVSSKNSYISDNIQAKHIYLTIVEEERNYILERAKKGYMGELWMEEKERGNNAIILSCHLLL